ncbi:MAG: TGS domain-containing protein, partial [Gammaproteobacteria bacterium]|nr:TGS domain-containing protein [Gammaproteobacteria bacterium]
GHVVDMMKGATPLDFAYYVHTEVGNKCCGARVNGKTVPLNYRLQTGDRVEVLADDNSSPSRDWLKPGLGYANTPRAQAKLMQWFKTQGREQNVTHGKTLLTEEFERLAVKNPNYRELARKLGCRNEETLFAAVGVSAITVDEVINAAQDLSQLLCVLDESTPVSVAVQPSTQVYGAGRFPTQLGTCCAPQPGDAIAGCLVEGNQVVVHRTDCAAVLQYQQTGHGNLIEVHWSDGRRVSIPVELFILAYDRAGLLRDITTILADARIEVMEVNTRTDRAAGTARMSLQIEVGSFHELSRVLEKISHLNNVIEARRVDVDLRSAGT